MNVFLFLIAYASFFFSDPSLFGEDTEPTSEKNRPNLSLLRPLWTLYTSSIESDIGKVLSSVYFIIHLDGRLSMNSILKNYIIKNYIIVDLYAYIKYLTEESVLNSLLH